jgi:Glycosyltransferase family 87
MRPLGKAALAVAVAGALALTAISFAVELRLRTTTDIESSDLRVYQPYGSEIVAGKVPYRDFSLEYPPGALPMFALPAAFVRARGSTETASWAPMNSPAKRYYHAFTLQVILLTAAALVVTALTLAARRRPAWNELLALGVVALSPLMLGDVFPGRFDIWPALLVSGALALAVRGHYRLGGLALGLGAATKLYPVLLVPCLAIVAARHRGLREGALAVVAAVGAAVAVFLPFLIESFSGTWTAIRVQFQGGLQIETLAGSALVEASHLAQWLQRFGFPPPSQLTNRAIETGIQRSVLVGPGVHATAAAMDVLLAVALVVLYVQLARTRTDHREALLRYSAAAVTVTLVLGSVLSPQYLIWLVPLVPLVGGRRGLAATALFAVAAVLTHFWFPAGYRHYENGLEAGPASLLFARNLTLLAMGIVLVWPRRYRSSNPNRAET